MRIIKTGIIGLAVAYCVHANAQQFKLNSSGYFRNQGVNVMAFDDIYPEGHQGGLGIIMHGHRVAANGDIRLEATPGQWQPVPVQRERKLDLQDNSISVSLSYPDTSRHLRGVNPMIYPDLQFDYIVKVKGEGDSLIVTVDLDQALPTGFIGKVGFNLELYPGDLFGRPWIMDQQAGIFPRQPNGPTLTVKEEGKDKFHPLLADEIIAAPYAAGDQFVMLPNDPCRKLTVRSEGAELRLYDGRLNHNNGWFVLRSEIPAGKTKEAIKWIITPHVIAGWIYSPVIQTSQLGYHPAQPKQAIIELDVEDDRRLDAKLIQITPAGEKLIRSVQPSEWGKFLRYNYLIFDFSAIRDEGLYQVCYGNSVSSIFRIASDVYDRGAWQPVLEYFLPIQMCHMRVNEKYRVWHDICHLDDARMAPVDQNHFDGYSQGPSTLTKYKSGEIVPGLNSGGWHDAGDYDLRIESQSGEAYILALAYEAFKVDYDETDINQDARIVEIHQPDGKPDLLQQVENGALTVVGGYLSLGRLYRGIICNDLRQYVLLGDGSAMTNQIIGDDDDRWVFTEDNPARELTTAAHLAAVSRVLKGFNDTLGIQALEIARTLFEKTSDEGRAQAAKIHAATELYLTTGERTYRDYLIAQTEFIKKNIGQVAWFLGRADAAMKNQFFSGAVREALQEYKKELNRQSLETPYGIPYRPHIWGAGWNIQSFGFKHYFLVKAWPDLFQPDVIYQALDFILGCHPGVNTASFASGVGAKSITIAYGTNRADWSYIPGGVVSGTALIRPDFPELLEFPFLWQQTEYVMGGGSSHYLFLVLAAQQLLQK